MPGGRTTARAVARIAEGGRIVIPADYRKALGLRTGDRVMLQLQDGEIRIRSLEAGIRRAQQLVRRVVPADRSLVDELIAERRSEASRD